MNREQIIEAMARAMERAEDNYEGTSEFLRYQIAAALTALETAIPGLADVIAGKAIVVPVEPTEAMLTAGRIEIPCDEFLCEGNHERCLCRKAAAEGYRAMIEARPK